MSFTEPVFLFAFLPLMLAIYFLSPRNLRNVVLLGASVLFYVWTQKQYGLVLLGSVILNYGFGLAIHRAREMTRRRRLVTLAVIANLLLLATFKLPGFLVLNLNRALNVLDLPTWPTALFSLPLGVSFFSLMAMSYVIDVYRGEIESEQKPLQFSTYLTLFPYVIAGPIVRYAGIKPQLVERRETLDDFALGVRRFIVGFGKKVLIANTLALTVDTVFTRPLAPLSAGAAWYGVAIFALQLYFDISGYADMAIGLGRMFGFRLPENFNYPYVAQSMTDFWKRWHITLVSWFRDYVFFPISYRRPAWRIHFNLIVVFVLCGLWHEVSWRFLAWGLAHGALLSLERAGLGKFLLRLPLVLRHAYVILAIVTTGVFVRVLSLPDCVRVFRALAGFGAPGGLEFASVKPGIPMLIVIAIAIAACLPIVPALRRWHERLSQRMPAVPARALYVTMGFVRVAALGIVLIVAMAMAASGTYKAFIYFQY
jgi:alginate O-acetyltransferase complex protein AlgI